MTHLYMYTFCRKFFKFIAKWKS